MSGLMWLFVWSGCSGETPIEPATTVPPPDPPVEPTEVEAWCQVQAVFQSQCLLCHRPANLLGDLDLETDPYGALVGVTSAATGDLLVDPGNPDGSLLVRKMEGTQDADEGSDMPPSGLLDAASQALVRDWVADGAPEVCGGGVPTGDTGPVVPYHPDDYAEAANHGLSAKFQSDVCTACHGAALDGGEAGVSCQDCHVDVVKDWTTDCTFCHGDRATGNAAPPEDIDDNADLATTSFPPHTVHVLGDPVDPLHLGWDCVECHGKPTDVFSAGHVFTTDDTPGVAEVQFDSPGARSPDAVYTPGLNCSNVYCHGSGQPGGEGTIAVDDAIVCGGCHGVATNWGSMSGQHADHLREDIGCEECHETAESAPYEIVEPALHINGTRDVRLPPSMVFVGGTCDGRCHGERHDKRTW